MGGFKFSPKKTGLAAALEEQEKAKREAAALVAVDNRTVAQKERAEAGFVEPELAEDRIKIIFDDSGSMSGQKIIDARQGCIEFLRYCTVNRVAVGVYPMNKEPIAMDTNLPELAALIEHINATGGTPMFTTLFNAQHEESKATRYIVFSDGVPTDNITKLVDEEYKTNMEVCILEAIDNKTPIDTVYIADGYTGKMEYKIMEELAERTGGIFLIFDRNKVNFGSAFKFLAPGQRLQLMSPEFKKGVEEGTIK